MAAHHGGRHARRAGGGGDLARYLLFRAKLRSALLHGRLLERRETVPVVATAPVARLEAECLPGGPIVRNVVEGVARQRSLALPLELEKSFSSPVLARLELTKHTRDGLPAPGLRGEIEPSCDRLVQERSSSGGFENLP